MSDLTNRAKSESRVSNEQAREASEGLDYLTDISRSSDYGNNDYINEAVDALAYVLDAHDYRNETP